MQINEMRVALDGPSGAGKSTIAKRVAERAGLLYVDTGALYRTIGLWVMLHGVAADDTDGIVALLPSLDIQLAWENGAQITLLAGEPTGDRIRTPEASRYASAVSKIPAVRDHLLALQRSLAEKGGVIMDGRDIGTVILPQAELKVFMTATLPARAKRRYLELVAKGVETTYDSVLTDMEKRDKNDRERDTAPCVPAEDAIVFVNDDYDIEQSADYILALMQKKIAELS